MNEWASPETEFRPATPKRERVLFVIDLSVDNPVCEGWESEPY